MSSPADGWAALLLSGVVGSLVGGGATFLAVWLTIRHERKLRDDDRLADAVGQAYAAAGRCMASFMAGDFLRAQGLNDFQTFLQATSAVSANAQRHAPPLARLLKDATQELTEATDQLDGTPAAVERIRVAVVHIHVALGRWIANPASIRGGLTIDELKAVTAEAMSSKTSETARDTSPSTSWRKRFAGWFRS